MGYIWSKDELQAVTKMAKANVPVEKMREVMPHRTIKSIIHKIADLGLNENQEKRVDWDKLQEILASSQPVEL